MVHEIHHPLSLVGKKLIHSLLNEGEEVHAVTSTQELENEFWMYYGRNALFKVSDEEENAYNHKWTIENSFLTYKENNKNAIKIDLPIERSLENFDDKISDFIVANIKNLKPGDTYCLSLSSARESKELEIRIDKKK
ncbi:hypothetical protein [Mangrovibacillus cuniculi]|uniref:Uncharacterized protein n=1 Tax=Mangrovibacillus cuniculi TaxID=2593652 RepID=A0A7S8C9U8_9BACI|nr:hypothetical protein [Mangrovibacillus cuniculi]QPC46060.1 hypothetical protein G8O30_03340 [Mangrovibacillus cuniculi]